MIAVNIGRISIGNLSEIKAAKTELEEFHESLQTHVKLAVQVKKAPSELEQLQSSLGETEKLEEVKEFREALDKEIGTLLELFREEGGPVDQGASKSSVLIERLKAAKNELDKIKGLIRTVKAENRRTAFLLKEEGEIAFAIEEFKLDKAREAKPLAVLTTQLDRLLKEVDGICVLENLDYTKSSIVLRISSIKSLNKAASKDNASLEAIEKSINL